MSDIQNPFLISISNTLKESCQEGGLNDINVNQISDIEKLIKLLGRELSFHRNLSNLYSKRIEVLEKKLGN